MLSNPVGFLVKEAEGDIEYFQERYNLLATTINIISERKKSATSLLEADECQKMISVLVPMRDLCKQTADDILRKSVRKNLILSVLKELNTTVDF